MRATGKKFGKKFRAAGSANGTSESVDIRAKGSQRETKALNDPLKELEV